MLSESETNPCDPDAADCRDAGSALVMAVLVSVVVFVLGAMWMSIASHESSASDNDRRRQHAIDAAMAGLVVADSELSGNDLYVGTDDEVTAFGVGTGEFEVTVEDVAGAPLRRLVRSVGYAPSRADPARTVRTVEQVVDLEAVGFTYGIFAVGSIATRSASTVIGDVYSGDDISFGNSQDYFGDIFTRGDIVAGSNSRVIGSLHANGSIDLTRSSKTMEGSAYAGVNIQTGGTITDNAQAGGTIVTCGNVVGSCLVNSPPPEVPLQLLPTFVWDPSRYPSVTTATSGTVVSVVQAARRGVFYVSGNVSFKKNEKISLLGDMTIVATGSVDLPGEVSNATTDGQAVQLTVISTGGGVITPANNFTIPATVRTLFYTQGLFDAKNSSTFSGVLYAGAVDAGANLSVTYEPVSGVGFDWSAASPQNFTIRNISTREVANGS